MRGEYVDERDSSWERGDPRFRVFVFRGAGNAVTAVDIVDATVEDALDSARALSNGDEDLWSLALIDDDSRGVRGLVWLSGMDYNDSPLTPVEWRRASPDAGALPDGQSATRVGAVVAERTAADPGLPRVGHQLADWESFTDDYNLEGESLGLSPDLSRALVEWNHEWQARSEDEPLADPEGWRARGVELVHRLRSELTGIAEIRPEFL